jgi:hypothetical protein
MKINKLNNYVFVILFIFALVIFVLNIKTKKEYEIKYELNGYKIKEKYNKKEDIYIFNITTDNIIFPFVFNTKYSNKKKLLKDINEEKINDGICLTVTVTKNKKSLCYKDGNLLSKDALIEKVYKHYKTKSNIKVYNEKHDYFIWNGYGYTDILSGKKYNFLKKEIYDNNLTYQVDNYIVSPDYDQKKVFNKFYVFNMITKKISKMEVDDISFDMYYLGELDSIIYIFDRTKSNEYKYDVGKSKISKVSNNDYGVIYDRGLTEIDINKLKYQDISFTYDYLFNHYIDNNLLYVNVSNKIIDKKKINILLSKNNITDIIRRDENNIYYLSDDKLYVYTFGKGEELLLNYFEWNFNYKNKIFVY